MIPAVAECSYQRHGSRSSRCQRGSCWDKFHWAESPYQRCSHVDPLRRPWNTCIVESASTGYGYILTEWLRMPERSTQGTKG